MEPISLLYVFLAGLVGAFFGTNVGGGGLLTYPVLVFVGLDPKVAIATHLLGGFSLTIAGLIQFHKAKKIDFAIGWPMMGLIAVGAVIGANILLSLSSAFIERFIGYVILALLAVTVFRKNMGLTGEKVSGTRKLVGYVVIFLIGIWGGIFSGGMGILMLYTLLFFFGKTFLESAGTMKVAGLGIALPALTVFWLHDLLLWEPGLVLFVSMFIGSYLGAHYAIKKGDAWVRGLFFLVVGVMALKLMFF